MRGKNICLLLVMLTDLKAPPRDQLVFRCGRKGTLFGRSRQPRLRLGGYCCPSWCKREMGLVVYFWTQECTKQTMALVFLSVMQKSKSKSKNTQTDIFFSVCFGFCVQPPSLVLCCWIQICLHSRGLLVVPGLSTQEGSIGMLTWTFFLRGKARDIGRDGSKILNLPSHFASSHWALNMFRGFWLKTQSKQSADRVGKQKNKEKSTAAQERKRKILAKNRMGGLPGGSPFFSYWILLPLTPWKKPPFYSWTANRMGYRHTRACIDPAVCLSNTGDSIDVAVMGWW